MSARFKLAVLIALLALMSWMSSPRPTYADHYCEDINGTACPHPNGTRRTCEFPDGFIGSCFCRNGTWTCTI
jgi:hypothetical protein